MKSLWSKVIKVSDVIRAASRGHADLHVLLRPRHGSPIVTWAVEWA